MHVFCTGLNTRGDMPLLEQPIILSREYYGTGLMKEISAECWLKAEGSGVPHVRFYKNETVLWLNCIFSSQSFIQKESTPEWHSLNWLSEAIQNLKCDYAKVKHQWWFKCLYVIYSADCLPLCSSQKKLHLFWAAKCCK